VGGRGPHGSVCCHFVGANSDGLNNLRGPRYFVYCHCTGAACGSSDRAEEIAACAICGGCNTSGVLVTDSHARLYGVGGCLAAVRGVEGRAGEVLATIDGVDGTVGVSVVPVAVGRAKSLGWRSNSGGGWWRNRSTATVGWWKAARRAWRRGNTTVRWR
jgi:hypothetical protein